MREILIESRRCGRSRLILGVATFCFSIFCLRSVTHAQLPTIKDERLGVDALYLQDGTRLYGFVLGTESRGGLRVLKFSVERGWLEATHSKRAEKYAAEEELKAAQARQTFVERVQQWIADREDEVGFTNMLRTDLAKFESSLDQGQVGTTRFVVLHIPVTQIKELKQAVPAKRKVAGLAYMHRLPDIVTTPASILEKRLKEREVDIPSESVDLSQDLPVSATQPTERQWAAKQALFEYQYRKPLEYQGTGTMLFKKSDKAPDVAALMQSLMGSGSGANDILQLGADLGLPEFSQFQKPKSRESDWSKKIAGEAEEDGFRGFLVYRLEQNMLSPVVSVTTHFFAKEREGPWFTAYRHVSKVDTTRPTEAMQARIERIKQDPQIEQVTNLLSGLGLGGGGSQLDKALVHGAATEEALESARRSFTEFANRYGDDITFPPVPIAEERP